jgi:ATP-dependent Lon protease
VDVIRGEMFSPGHDFSDRYKRHFSLSEEISTRDRDGINKTFSGLMKILYPQGEATESEIEDLLRAANEGKDGQEKLVRTLEEDEYPNQYTVACPSKANRKRVNLHRSEPPSARLATTIRPPAAVETGLKELHT